MINNKTSNTPRILPTLNVIIDSDGRPVVDSSGMPATTVEERAKVAPVQALQAANREKESGEKFVVSNAGIIEIKQWLENVGNGKNIVYVNENGEPLADEPKF